LQVGPNAGDKRSTFAKKLGGKTEVIESESLQCLPQKEEGFMKFNINL